MGDTNMSSEMKEIFDCLKDLIFINGIIATELITLVENSSRIVRKSKEIPDSCREAHGTLNEKILEIVERYWGHAVTPLKSHVRKH